VLHQFIAPLFWPYGGFGIAPKFCVKGDCGVNVAKPFSTVGNCHPVENRTMPEVEASVIAEYAVGA